MIQSSELTTISIELTKKPGQLPRDRDKLHLMCRMNLKIIVILGLDRMLISFRRPRVYDWDEWKLIFRPTTGIVKLN